MKYYNEKIETMSTLEMRSLQSERLAEVVARVYNNVPYYRAKMDEIKLKPSDIKSIDDIVKLPYTTKHDLRENYPFGLFAAPKKDIVRVHASSGTTGKLTVVGLTKRDLEDWSECVARSLVMAGCSDEDTIHISYGYGLFTGGLGIHYGAEKLGAVTVPVSSGNTMRQIMLLKDFEATVLCCTPSYAIFLAEEMERMGVKPSDLKLKIGIFGAEPWSDSMRFEIEKRFNIKACDIYGLSEISGPGVSMSCGNSFGLHVMEDFFYPEIIDTETLEPLGDMERGELVFTTLNKQGIPLLRYRTRDISELKHELCPTCGRTLVKMKRVSGRSDDMLIIRGVNVFPSQIETVLLNIPSLIGSHYMIIADRVGNLDTIEVQVEVNEAIFSDEVKELEKVRKNVEYDMQSMLGISAKITLMSPNSLPLSEGKTKRIIDNRKIKG
ncbi:MAG TPA: phenylacetate--CoA ligase [Clostridia bacterium]|nr:phenylacetate--CoA ligase [Clostridia bacterium]